MEMFSYTRGTAAFNDIIDETLSFASAYLDNKVVENKDERLKTLNLNLGMYCAEDTKVAKYFEEKGLDAFKDPHVTKNRDFLDNFDAVIAQVINPILPMVANFDMIRFLADVRQIGYGDTARFIIRSNELYKVNEIAEGVNRGVLQPIHNNEITVNPSPIEIAAECDWYQMAAGVFDLADWGLRVARSFEQYIFLKVIGALTSGVDSIGAAYKATGFTQTNWTTLAQRVAAANGNSDVFAIGTLAALGSIIPAQAGLQYGLGKEIVEKGYLDRYYGTRLLVLDQALKFNTVNTTAEFAIPDDMIYFLPVYGDKPIKLVYEGDNILVEREYTRTPDKTYRVRIQERRCCGKNEKNGYIWCSDSWMYDCSWWRVYSRFDSWNSSTTDVSKSVLCSVCFCFFNYYVSY